MLEAGLQPDVGQQPSARAVVVARVEEEPTPGGEGADLVGVAAQFGAALREWTTGMSSPASAATWPAQPPDALTTRPAELLRPGAHDPFRRGPVQRRDRVPEPDIGSVATVHPLAASLTAVASPIPLAAPATRAVPRIAAIVGKSQEDVRQLAARARRHVGQGRPRWGKPAAGCVIVVAVWQAVCMGGEPGHGRARRAACRAAAAL